MQGIANGVDRLLERIKVLKEGIRVIKVIKYGKKRRMTCGNCDALLEFEQDDISTVKTGMNEFEQYIRCPSCGEAVTVRYLRFDGGRP